MTRKTVVALLMSSFLMLPLCALGVAADAAIANKGGRWWRDVDGNEMVLFPNSVLKVGDTWYMYGEWCFSDEKSGLNALRCYSSKDLSHWKFEGNVLTQEDSHLVNRGTVLFNEATRQYVYCYKFRRPMRFPGWQFGDGILAWAASSSPRGRFTIVDKDPRAGIVAGEACLFKDSGGKAYLVADGTYVASEGKRINVYELSPDYCSITRRVADLGTGHEAAFIARMKGRYWCFASGLNDWYYSPTSYRTAAEIFGPWTPWTELQTDPPSADSFKTQFGGLLFDVRGRSGTFVVFAGVRYWDTIPIGPISPSESGPPGVRPANLWLPLQWKGDVPFIRYYDTWYINAAAGTWSAKAGSRR